MKRKPTEWEETFTADTSDKALISRIYKLLINQRRKKTNDPINRWSKDLNRDFTSEELEMADKYLNKCATSLKIKEMQIKTTLRVYRHTTLNVPDLNCSRKLSRVGPG